MHIMLDLETMGKRHDAAIVSIGAVAFDPEVQDTIETIPDSRKFYANFDLQDQLYRKYEPEAVYWWLGSPGGIVPEGANDESRQTVLENRRMVLPVLFAYKTFCQEHDAKLAWCNGANFDHVVLQGMFDHHKIPNPHDPRQQMCMRTIRKAFKHRLPEMQTHVEGLKAHNALDDCIRQVIWLQNALRLLNSPV